MALDPFELLRGVFGRRHLVREEALLDRSLLPFLRRGARQRAIWGCRSRWRER